MSNRKTARQLAHQSIENGDALTWFEQLYDLAQRDSSVVPWADLEPNPNAVEWLDRIDRERLGNRALVVGCGLGDDAEELNRRGFDVVAFDVSSTAITWAKERFSDSGVEYPVSDLFNPPEEWHHAFDFVLEIYTLQALPDSVHESAVTNLASFVKPGGTLLVISRGRDESDSPGEMPWPLTRSQLAAIRQHGLEEVAFEDYVDREDPPVRRFRVEYRTRGASSMQ